MVGAVGAVLFGILFMQQAKEFTSWGAERAVVFSAAFGLALFGLYKRISIFDIFALCLIAGLAIKLIARII